MWRAAPNRLSYSPRRGSVPYRMFATYFASVKKVRLPRCWIVNGWPSLALAVFQESKTGHFCLQRSVDRLRSRLFGCTLRAGGAQSVFLTGGTFSEAPRGPVRYRQGYARSHLSGCQDEEALAR